MTNKRCVHLGYYTISWATTAYRHQPSSSSTDVFRVA